MSPDRHFWVKTKPVHRYLREAYSRGLVNRFALDHYPDDRNDKFSRIMWKLELFEVRAVFVITLLLFLAPPIGGFVVVGFMIREEGRCLILG
jgi:hypothetical protein